MRGETTRSSILVCVWAICVAVVGTGCDFGPKRSSTVLSPTPVTAPPVPPPPPRPAHFSERFTEVAVGDLVRHSFTEADPVCDEYPPLLCLFYRVTPGVDGVLDLNLTITKRNPIQGLDISLWDPQLGADTWWDPVRAPIKAGVTYQITVWYGTPGVEFEMRSAIR
jgi:hypothetical protein